MSHDKDPTEPSFFQIPIDWQFRDLILIVSVHALPKRGRASSRCPGGCIRFSTIRFFASHPCLTVIRGFALVLCLARGAVGSEQI